MERVAGRLAGLLAQEQLEVGHSPRSRGSIAGSRKGAMVGMTPMPKLAVQRLALGARHVGQLLGLAQDAQRLFGDLLARAA